MTLAERLLREFGVADPDDIDVEDIALRQGITVKKRFLTGCQAYVVGKGDRGIISVAEDCSESRYRFSVGHELGHWNHHKGEVFICRSDDIGAGTEKKEERVADEFAADLLMPRYLFEPKIGDMSLDLAESLAEDFRVSLQTAALRLVELGTVPSMLIVHRSSKTWFRKHHDISWEMHLKLSVPAGSSAASVLHQGIAKSEARSVNAATWIDNPKAGNHEVIEQSIRFGQDQALTMIWWPTRAQFDEQRADMRRKRPFGPFMRGRT